MSIHTLHNHETVATLTPRQIAIGVVALVVAIVSLVHFKANIPLYAAGELVSGYSQGWAITLALVCIVAAYIAYHQLVHRGGLIAFFAISFVACLIIFA